MTAATYPLPNTPLVSVESTLIHTGRRGARGDLNPVRMEAEEKPQLQTEANPEKLRSTHPVSVFATQKVRHGQKRHDSQLTAWDLPTLT